MTPFFVLFGLMVLGMGWAMTRRDWSAFVLYLVLAFIAGLAIYFKFLSLA